jgi:hypothetical protein
VKKAAGYENLTSRGQMHLVKPDEKKPIEWERVVVPTPLFDSAQQKLDTEAVQKESPRRPGEDINEWMQRWCVEAGLLRLSQTDLKPSREPGEDDGGEEV